MEFLKKLFGGAAKPESSETPTGAAMAQEVQKVPCKKCGKMIMPTTFNKTGGFCMPCFRSGAPERISDYSASNPEEFYAGTGPDYHHEKWNPMAYAEKRDKFQAEIRQSQANKQPGKYDTYIVASFRAGRTTHRVDFEPFSPHGGPISIWSREDNGNSCGVALSAEHVKENPHLMDILRRSKTTWLLEVCCKGLSGEELFEAFYSEFVKRNGREPVKA